MGVAGLWEVLSPGFEQRLPFDVFAAEYLKKHKRPLRLAIDAFGWLFELISTSNTLFGEHYFMSRVAYLLKLSVSFVLVFDGRFKPSFKNTGQAYTNLDYLDEYRTYVQMMYHNPDLSLEERELPSSGFGKALRGIKRKLLQWNISYIYSGSEGEADCALLQRLGIVDYVMSNDGDCVIFGATKVLRNFSRAIEDVPSSTIKGIHKEDPRWITPVHMDRVEQVTGMNQWRALFFALLNGSDYSGGIKQLGTRRALAASLIGSSTCPAPDLVDFAMRLKTLYIDEFIFDDQKRLKRLSDFKEQFRQHIMSNSERLFGNKLTGFNNSISGFPLDDVILAFFYPKINTLNVFEFINGMTNFVEIGRKCSLANIDPNSMHLNHVSLMIGLASPVSKVKINRISGINNTLPFVIGENTYKIAPLSKMWKLESLEYKFVEAQDNISKRLELPSFRDLARPLDNSVRNIAAAIKRLDLCYLVHFLAKNQLEEPEAKKDIFLDKSKTLAHPIKKINKTYSEKQSIHFELELVRITYHKDQLFNSIIAQYDGSYSANTDLYLASGSESSGVEDVHRIPSKKKDPDMVSCWVPREVVSYYATSVLESFEELARKAVVPPSPVKKKAQSTNLDSFNFLLSLDSQKKIKPVLTVNKPKSRKRKGGSPQKNTLDSFFQKRAIAHEEPDEFESVSELVMGKEQDSHVTDDDANITIESVGDTTLELKQNQSSDVEEINEQEFLTLNFLSIAKSLEIKGHILESEEFLSDSSDLEKLKQKVSPEKRPKIKVVETPVKSKSDVEDDFTPLQSLKENYLDAVKPRYHKKLLFNLSDLQLPTDEDNLWQLLQDADSSFEDD